MLSVEFLKSKQSRNLKGGGGKNLYLPGSHGNLGSHGPLYLSVSLKIKKKQSKRGSNILWLE